jgi:hypothetical protein
MHTPFCPWPLVQAYLLSTPAVCMPNARHQPRAPARRLQALVRDSRRLTVSRCQRSTSDCTCVRSYRWPPRRQGSPTSYRLSQSHAAEAPISDTQLARDPVVLTAPVLMLQSVVPLSVPGSRVPNAATCHSACWLTHWGRRIERRSSARGASRLDAGQELWPPEEAAKTESRSHEHLSSGHWYETGSRVKIDFLWQIPLALSRNFASAAGTPSICLEHYLVCPDARRNASNKRSTGAPSWEAFSACRRDSSYC